MTPKSSITPLNTIIIIHTMSTRHCLRLSTLGVHNDYRFAKILSCMNREQGLLGTLETVEPMFPILDLPLHN